MLKVCNNIFSISLYERPFIVLNSTVLEAAVDFQLELENWPKLPRRCRYFDKSFTHKKQTIFRVYLKLAPTALEVQIPGA